MAILALSNGPNSWRLIFEEPQRKCNRVVYERNGGDSAFPGQVIESRFHSGKVTVTS